MTPAFLTVDATDMSSGDSPEPGIITSPPVEYTELFFGMTNVSTVSMTDSYFVYIRPYNIIGFPSLQRSVLEYPDPFENVTISPNV